MAAAKGGASALIRTVDDEGTIKVTKRNEEDGEAMEEIVSLKDGCLPHSTLQSHFPDADSLTYCDSDGVTRKLKQEDGAWRPPRGGVWRDNVTYLVVSLDPNAPAAEVETKKKKSCEIF